MTRTNMMNKILNNEPGIYFHASYKAIFYAALMVIIIAVLCIHSINVQINPGPSQYPMFIDGKKIYFMGREPQSVAEAREILSQYDRYVEDGAHVVVPVEK